MSNLHAALNYATRGWPVLPVDGYKHPLYRLVPNAVKDATTDTERITAWWTDSPDAPVAVAGGNGLLLVDLDLYRHPDALDALERSYGPLPATWTEHTPGQDGVRGLHKVLRVDPTEDIRACDPIPGVELRYTNRYIVVSPSPGYEVIDETEPAWAPTALVELLTSSPTTGVAGQVQGKVVSELPEDAYSQGMLDSFYEEASKFEGRSHQVWHVMCRCAEVGFTQGQVWTAVLNYGPALEKTDEQPGWLEADFDRFLNKPNGWQRCHQKHLDTVSAKPEATSSFDELVQRKLFDLKASETARNLLEAEKLANKPIPVASTLTELLAKDWPEQSFLVEGLWPAEGNVLLAAQAKVGKTTLIVNLIKALLDGQPFLGAHQVSTLDGRVGLLNLEMSGKTMTNWLGKAGIAKSDDLSVWNLRGQAGLFDIRNAKRREEWAKLVADAGIQVLVLDCLTPVLTALNLNEDKELRVLLYAFSELQALAGVREGFVVHHTGWDASRPRGDSASIGWGDANWNYIKDGEDSEAVELGSDGKQRIVTKAAPRLLSANGRDVELPKSQLSFDYASLQLKMSLTPSTVDDQLEMILHQPWVSMWWQRFETDPVSVTTLIESEVVTKATFHRHIKPLLRAGLAERSGTDKQTRYHLTGDPTQ